MDNKNNINKNQSVNQITIDCLINKDMYEKYVSKTEIKKDNLKDLKFYRKRIYDLVKKLLVSKEERDNMNPDVQHAFNILVKTSINYFKTLDKQDILQKDYEDLKCNESVKKSMGNALAFQNNEQEGEEEDGNAKWSEANSFIMKKINMKNEKCKDITDFVIRKEATKETMIYPNKREFNLKDDSLKNKGITKKKNINNKYVSKNEEDKDTDKDTDKDKDKDTDKDKDKKMETIKENK